MEAKHVTPDEFKAQPFEPGSRSRYLVYVGELSTGSPLEIPVEVIAGKRKGPTVFVGAGQHGEEPAGMVAVSSVMRRLAPEDVKGTVIAVPLQNPPAWAFRSRHFPLDAPNVGDVAGMQSGDPGGVMSSRVVSALTDAIATRAQYALDVHATHLDSVNYPRAMVTITGAEPEDVQAQRLELGRAVGFEVIHLWKRAGHGGVDAILNRKGIPTIAIEAGEGWRALEPFPSMMARAIVNFLRHTGALDGTPEMPEMQVEVTTRRDVPPEGEAGRLRRAGPGGGGGSQHVRRRHRGAPLPLQRDHHPLFAAADRGDRRPRVQRVPDGSPGVGQAHPAGSRAADRGSRGQPTGAGGACRGIAASDRPDGAPAGARPGCCTT